VPSLENFSEIFSAGKEIATTEYYDEYGEDDYDANAIYGQQKKFAPQSAVAHKKVI
jgi:hypothetical protein